MSEPRPWKIGDRVIVRLPDKRRQSGIRGGRSRDIDVHGTVRAVDLPGRHPGVKVDLDEEINGVRDCYATHRELRPEAPERHPDDPDKPAEQE